MKRGIIVLPFLWVLICLLSCSKEKQSFAVISKTELNDKIKGAWAGKMIGVMKGIGMEFKAASVTYEDSIIWYPEMIERALLEDDIYGQLSFMSSMVRNQGLQTPVSKLAEDFANAEFNLCHANLQARKNFFDGIMPPLSGAPDYNMHANDIDFQIESDYIGFINPGMPRAATLMADSVGRIMAYGDGLYGGMFVSAMHALAFFEKDAKVVVKKALQAIPSESQYAKAIQTVIDGYEQDPSNWRSTWQILQDRWGESDLCVPYHPFNIDATINGAYIAMGLLYGENNMEKTIEIAIRCGQDTDCNAANAAAVLGIIQGYEAIDEELKSHIPEMADKPFLYTDISFNKAVSLTQSFAEENILTNGGNLEDDIYRMKLQPLLFSGQLEQAFPNMSMSHFIQMSDTDLYRIEGNWEDFRYGEGDNDLYKVSTTPGDIFEVEFSGSGISVLGSYNIDGGTAMAYIDGEPFREFNCYHRTEAGKWNGNRQHIIHKMDLAEGDHTLRIVVSDKKEEASTGHKIYIERVIVYKDTTLSASK